MELISPADELLQTSLSSVLLGDATLIDRTFAAIDRAGYSAGSASAGPGERLRKFFDEKLIPALAKAKDQFEALVLTATTRITETIGDALTLVEQTLRDERFSGYTTQAIIVIAGTGDALAKLLPGAMAGQLDFSHFSNTDWVMLSLAYLMYRDSRAAKTP